MVSVFLYINILKKVNLNFARLTVSNSIRMFYKLFDYIIWVLDYAFYIFKIEKNMYFLNCQNLTLTNWHEYAEIGDVYVQKQL